MISKYSFFVELFAYLEPLVCLVALASLYYRGRWRAFSGVTGLLATRIVSFCLLWPLLHSSSQVINVRLAYELYFYVYWISYFTEAIFGLVIVYQVYKLAMAPLPGLQTLGMIMFRWAAAIAVAIAIGMAFGPRVSSQFFIIKAISELQQTQSIITLCLLLFVTLAIRPMGLSFGSKIFGVTLGMGVLSTFSLVESAWLDHLTKVATQISALSSIVFCSTVLMWTAYFALPDPKRRMIVLPTTSPFLRWNQISLALGDAPGFVAIAGIDPEMLTPAEVEIMLRASQMEPAGA